MIHEIDSQLTILVIGDIHGDVEALAHIMLAIDGQHFDAAVLVGDIGLSVLSNNCTKEDRRYRLYQKSSECCLDMVKTGGARTFFVPGNWDSPLAPATWRGTKNLDMLSILEIDPPNVGGFTFLGVGGSSFITGALPYEWGEEEMKEKLGRSVPSDVEWDRCVLVSHDPPYGTSVDVNKHGQHRGSKAIRNFILEYAPSICLTGHIHEAAGVDLVGKTLVVNPGGVSTIISVSNPNLAPGTEGTRLYGYQFAIIKIFSPSHVVVNRHFVSHDHVLTKKIIRRRSHLETAAPNGLEKKSV